MKHVAIIGAVGRMGGALVRCSLRFSNLRIVAALEQPKHPDLGRDVGAAAGIGDIGVRITDDPGAAAGADALIDFSFHAAAPASAALAVKLGRGLVLGTTGLNAAEEAAVRQAATRVPVLWAPNMSLGVNLLFAMVERAAAVLSLDYDAEIVEMHHRYKKDSPSGTALRLAEKVAAGRRQALKDVASYGRHGLVGERPPGQIGVHSVRGGDVVGDHTVTFAAEGERLEFTHRASSRDCFAIGALKGALWIAGRAPGLYDMKDVLGL